MGGNLKNNVPTTRLDALAQKFLQIKRLRRGSLSRQHTFANLVSDRADQACGLVCAFKQVLNKESRGALAVRACYSDHLQPAGRVAVISRRQPGQCLT